MQMSWQMYSYSYVLTIGLPYLTTVRYSIVSVLLASASYRVLRSEAHDATEGRWRMRTMGDATGWQGKTPVRKRGMWNLCKNAELIGM